MIFYDCNTAPSPRRVRMFIQEKKINIETKNVDLRNSEQMEDWFSKINPRNTVPVLVSKENNIFYHSLSICVYLEQEFPEINLLGSTNEEKGQIINLINDIESNLDFVKKSEFNYSKVDENGFIKEGEYVTDDDVLIC